MASALSKRIATFFDDYAAASLAGDAKKVGGAYAATYLEAAPAGVEAFTVDADYRKAVQEKAAAMQKMGLLDSAVKVTAVTPIAPGHVLVETTWRLRIAPAGKKAVETSFPISYVVREEGEALQILLAISHEDEAEAMKKLGLAS